MQVLKHFQISNIPSVTMLPIPHRHKLQKVNRYYCIVSEPLLLICLILSVLALAKGQERDILIGTVYSDSHHSNDPGIFPDLVLPFAIVAWDSEAKVLLFVLSRDLRYSAHSFHTFSSSRYRSITQGLQLLPQQSPAAGFNGFSWQLAAVISAVSRTGASLDFRRRANVGECFRASIVVAVWAIAPAFQSQWTE